MATPRGAHAVATLVTSDAYLPGALTLAAALRDLHPVPPTAPQVAFQTVCIVTPESVDVSTVRSLRNAFDLVVGVELITQEDQLGLQLLGRLDLNTVLTKLHVFRLTQFSKIIFLDADVLPVQPLSHLLTISHEFSAVPDVGWPDIFNSGVMVLTPGEDKFAELNELFKSQGSWDGGDQGLLNEWRGGNWNRLSFIYNTTPTAAYTYAPAYERFGSQISAIHFIGPNKPWSDISSRVPFSSQLALPSSQQAYDYAALVDRWYAVYDKHYRTKATSPTVQFEFAPYTPVWNEKPTVDKDAPPTTPTVRPYSLDELKRLAIGGMNASVSSYPTYNKNLNTFSSAYGDYRSMPLDGRVDLMRQNTQTLPGGKTADRKDKNRSGFFQGLSEDEGPLTPLSVQINAPLPTPGPNEVPASPHPRPIALPPVTPTPRFPHPHYFTSSEPGSPSRSPAHLQEHGQAQLQHYQTLLYSEPPRRGSRGRRTELETSHVPYSPTAVTWNPAVGPPPTSPPRISSFSSDIRFASTRFSKASSSGVGWRQGSKSPQTASPPGALFEPPQHTIPESMVRQGQHHATAAEELVIPSPDRAKVKNVFPWEEKPRRAPGRVFPTENSPKPSLFLSPERHTASSLETPTTPESKSGHLPTALSPLPALSPLKSFPVTVGYTNAWDAVPSIQKYAEKLVEPPTPKTLAPPFVEDQKRGKRASKSWKEITEVSSQDGDVEDEGDDTADEQQKAVRDGSESDGSAASSRKGSSTTTKTKKEEKTKKWKEYCDVGIQTDPLDMRDQSIQTAASPSPNHSSVKPNITTKRWWAPSRKHDTLPSENKHDVSIQFDHSTAMATQHHHRIMSLPSSPRSPVFTVSPRVRHASSSLAPPPTFTTLRPPRSPSPALSPPTISSQVSNDSSSLASPASSVGPASPSPSTSDGRNSPRPRKGGRVWDPARGVEVFKRGSEEVLARFLRMRSWEDEQR